jgi:hypothetical protein
LPGSGTFQVEKPATGSLAGFGLGILGRDTNDDGDGAPEIAIVGNPLHGDTLIKHAFIEAGGGLSGSVAFTVDNVNLIAALGILEAGVVDGSGNFTVGASLTLNDPSGDGKILLTELGPGLVSAAVTADADAPANGQVRDGTNTPVDATFTVAVDGGAAVAVSGPAAATQANANRDQLAADINAALAAVSFPASYAGTPYEGKTLAEVIAASIVDQKVVLSGAVGSLAVAGAEELGFPASATSTSAVIAPDVTASGSLTLPFQLNGL